MTRPSASAPSALAFACGLLYAALGPSAAHAADARGNYAVWGMGAKSCFAFRKAADPAEKDGFRQFVMGYLTAYNTVSENTYRIEGNMTLDEIMAWLGDYCDAQQMHSFEQALTDFTSQHADSRLKNAPNPSGR